MKKIAIYSRKSKFTGKGESIENQILKCKQFIKFKFETEEIETFIDEGFSGKNEDRPRYQEMLSKVKDEEIDKIVIYQLNRLGRNARDIHNTMQMCDDLGCVIYSATEGFDSSTSFGRALIGILASLAQLEREQLAERVKDNMYTLAKMGRWLGGQSPLGFKGTREYYIDENGKERSVTELKPNKEELQIVKSLYDKYLEEKSLSQVAKWTLINNLKGKNGADLGKSVINSTLQNPVYVKSDKKVIEFLENNAVKFIADGYSAYPLAKQQFELEENKQFDLTQVIGLTNDDPVSEEYRWVKQVVERLNRTYKTSYRVTCGYGSDNGALYGFSLWVAYYNFLRPHPYNYWRPLNELTELKNADNMPAKWQILISLGQQTILNMQENKCS